MSVRPAATIVLARPGRPDLRIAPGPGPPEVLVLRRAPRSRFLPGFVVFPGGAVEEQDTELSLRWFGTKAERARACALRELAEETGLAVTARGVAPVPKNVGLVRPPAVEMVPEIARWIAPRTLPVRFDARFFAAAAGREVEPRHDGVEAEAAWWQRPRELVEAYRRGEVQLMWPTLKMLEALQGCESVEDVLGLHVDQVGPPPSANPNLPMDHFVP